MGRSRDLRPYRKTINLSWTEVEFSRKFASMIESPLRSTGQALLNPHRVVARSSGRRKVFSHNDVLYEGMTHDSECRGLCGKP